MLARNYKLATLEHELLLSAIDSLHKAFPVAVLRIALGSGRMSWPIADHMARYAMYK
jgi:hypothetical protein